MPRAATKKGVTLKPRQDTRTKTGFTPSGKAYQSKSLGGGAIKQTKILDNPHAGTGRTKSTIPGLAPIKRTGAKLYSSAGGLKKLQGAKSPAVRGLRSSISQHRIASFAGSKGKIKSSYNPTRILKAGSSTGRGRTYTARSTVHGAPGRMTMKVTRGGSGTFLGRKATVTNRPSAGFRGTRPTTTTKITTHSAPNQVHIGSGIKSAISRGSATGAKRGVIAGAGKAIHELGNKKNFISSGGNTQLHVRKTVTK